MKFSSVSKNVIPKKWYIIQNGVLLGLTDEGKRNLSSRFSISKDKYAMVIPEDVVAISNSAFSSMDDTIRYDLVSSLSIPKTLSRSVDGDDNIINEPEGRAVRLFGDNFSGLTNLDLIECEQGCVIIFGIGVFSDRLKSSIKIDFPQGVYCYLDCGVDSTVRSDNSVVIPILEDYLYDYGRSKDGLTLYGVMNNFLEYADLEFDDYNAQLIPYGIECVNENAYGKLTQVELDFLSHKIMKDGILWLPTTVKFIGRNAFKGLKFNEVMQFAGSDGVIITKKVDSIIQDKIMSGEVVRF